MPNKRKHDHHWHDPNASHDPRPRRATEDPDVFFTLKVYSQKSGRDHRSLKFTVDFNAPFQANNENVEPYYVTADEKNVELFQQILEHVGEVYEYISNPTGYNKIDTNFGRTDHAGRRADQEALQNILRLTGYRINHFFYEQGSNNRVGVGGVMLLDGDGDPRPPKNG